MKKSKLTIAISRATSSKREPTSLPELPENADSLGYVLGFNFSPDLYKFRGQAASDLGLVLGSPLPQSLINGIPEGFNSI